MKNFTFNIPTKIIFGKKQILRIADEIPDGIKRIMIVTDPNLFKNTPIVELIQTFLKKYTVIVYKEIEENPTLNSVNKGGETAAQNLIDLIVGLGGGSAMDAAKGIAIRATNHENISSYVKGKQLSVDPLPIVCIPTTSGTGSEVTPFAVFTEPENEAKLGYSNNKIFPIFSIIDPELTYSMPETVILNTGLDSLAHAVEAYLSTESFEMNNQLALHSIDLVIDSLPDAVQKNKQAMEVMAYSAMLSGIAITHASTILPHIMGYPLTIYHGVAHGRAGIILLPAFLDYLKEVKASTEKISVLDHKFKSVGGLRAFLDQLRVSIKLEDYGVKKFELNNYVQKTIIKGDVAITPGNINEESILEIYINSM